MRMRGDERLHIGTSRPDYVLPVVVPRDRRVVWSFSARDVSCRGKQRLHDESGLFLARQQGVEHST